MRTQLTVGESGGRIEAMRLNGDGSRRKSLALKFNHADSLVLFAYYGSHVMQVDSVLLTERNSDCTVLGDGDGLVRLTVGARYAAAETSGGDRLTVPFDTMEQAGEWLGMVRRLCSTAPRMGALESE